VAADRVFGYGYASDFERASVTITLYRSPSELDGTAYFELLPGPYRDKCWCDGSRFMDEEAFGFIEPIFRKLCPKYDHYAFTEIGRPLWLDIVRELEGLRRALDNDALSEIDVAKHLSFYFRDGQTKFFEDVAGNLVKLKAMLLELTAWLREELVNHDMISVLGL
jgi:hypothetical protein